MFIKSIITKLQISKNPIKYWKKQGLKCGGGCEIYSSASFGSEPYLIALGNHVRVNHGVKFITHDGGVWVLRALTEDWKDIDLFGKIKVGNNVHIGTDATIMPGVTIGDNCIIGCGAIVTRDMPNNSVAVGVPARVVESLDVYIDKHKNTFCHTKNLSKKEKKEWIINHINF